MFGPSFLGFWYSSPIFGSMKFSITFLYLSLFFRLSFFLISPLSSSFLPFSRFFFFFKISTYLINSFPFLYVLRSYFIASTFSLFLLLLPRSRSIFFLPLSSLRKTRPSLRTWKKTLHSYIKRRGVSKMCRRVSGTC